MKKIIIVLIAAYIGFFAFQIYRKVEYKNNRADQRWQYFKQVIFDQDIDRMPITQNNITQWNTDIKIKIEGHPTEEDLKTVKATITQLNTLIAPKRILFADFSSKPDMYIMFNDRSEIGPINTWPKNVFSRCAIWTEIFYRDEIIAKYKITGAEQYIRTDSTTQAQRKTYIVKGMVNILLGLGIPHKKSQLEKSWQPNYSYFDNEGNNLEKLHYNGYKNSVFNSYCKNCTELSDIDNYIIKTYYSPKLYKLIENHNEAWYFRNFITFYYILIALCAVLIIFLYFSGFLGRTIFLFIDNKLRNKWISFNCKTVSVYLLFLVGWISTSILLSYIQRTDDKLLFPLGFHIFLTAIAKANFVWLAYILTSVNVIYVIEKVWLTRSEQFAKQQLFSFIIFVISILFTTYLLDHFIFKIYFYYAPLYVGGALGIARFLFNYSNYQRKLAVVEKEQEIKVLRELKTRAELNALQSKINPHFLYNALNSIAGLAHENADKVEQMAMALSKLFRYSINKEETDFATVQNEVEMVAIYLEIEKVRFDDRLEYSIQVADEAKDKKIPMFIIQPMVENAIKHGIANVTGKAILTLSIAFDKNKLLIKVSDNGPAFPEDLITGFGLHGIYEKLDILYPGRYEIKMQNGADKNISVLLSTSER
jgi:sensor histidine kinase YesM